MKINRVWAMPNKWTFTIKPVKEILRRYVGDGKGWIDPFAGKYSPAEITNDLNPEMPTTYHMDAFDFVDILDNTYKGCLFDPPYSIEQVTRSYEGFGLKSKLGFASMGAEDPTGSFKKVRDKIASHIEIDGYVISFGWNSSGFGKKRGFEIIEILLMCHGGVRNDTIATVEQKKWEQGQLFKKSGK